jgi:hypothetical protein
MSSFKTLFTPIYIVIALIIFIFGIVFLQVLDSIFAGSQNLSIIRLFCISIMININILIFLIMSFSKIKLHVGPQGPTGNKGDKGYEGSPGGLTVCGVNYLSVEEKKKEIKALNYLDLKPPLINRD